MEIKWGVIFKSQRRVKEGNDSFGSESKTVDRIVFLDL